ncbi:MAG TPA: ferritin [Bacillota bacterium]|nr:ferritin [Bacillota bacterium]
MIAANIEGVINEQIKLEMDSSQIYLAMAAYFHAVGLDGMAQWMKAQSREETGHAMKFFDHLVDRGGRVELSGLTQPRKEWGSVMEAFEDAYRHEQFITSKIHQLYKLTLDEADYAANGMLQWFVTEQVEEEASVSKIVENLKRIGNSGSGLIMLDHQLGKRA